MKVLGIDPGTKNYALVGLDAEGRAVYAALLEDTISSAAGKNAWMVKRHHFAIRKIIKKVAPDLVGAEQFITRGFGTVLTQFVNLMLGLLWGECHLRKIPYVHVSSSTWKNNIKPIGDLKALYAKAKAEYGLPPHLIDAMCIAIYTRNGEKFTYDDRALINNNLRRIARLMEGKNGVSAHGGRRRKKVRKNMRRED